MKPHTIGVLKQYFTAMSASITVTVAGTMLGWPSPVLRKLKDTGEPIQLSNEEISWMVSLLYIGNIISPLPTGYFMDLMGRKTSLIFLNIIPILSWILVLFAQNVLMLYIARFFAGAWLGIVQSVTSTYLAEISETKIRGTISTIMQLFGSLGVLLAYSIVPWFSFKITSTIMMLFPIIFLILFWYCPESPYWLLMKGKKLNAEKTLKWLRDETDVTVELTHIENIVNKEMRINDSFKEIFTSSGNRKAFLLLQIIGIVQRFSGISSINAFMSISLPTNFLNPDICVIIMGCVGLLGVIGSTTLIDSLGRKPLLIISTTICGFSTFAIGVWNYLNTNTNTDLRIVSWLPFISILTYIFGFSAGLGPVRLVFQGEIFTQNVRAKASSLSGILIAVYSFIVTKMYIPITDYIGLYLNFFIFSFSSFVGVIIFHLYLIETKGKDLAKIHSEFELKTKHNQSES